MEKENLSTSDNAQNPEKEKSSGFFFSFFGVLFLLLGIFLLSVAWDHFENQTRIVKKTVDMLPSENFSAAFFIEQSDGEKTRNLAKMLFPDAEKFLPKTSGIFAVYSIPAANETQLAKNVFVQLQEKTENEKTDLSLCTTVENIQMCTSDEIFLQSFITLHSAEDVLEKSFLTESLSESEKISFPAEKKSFFFGKTKIFADFVWDNENAKMHPNLKEGFLVLKNQTEKFFPFTQFSFEKSEKSEKNDAFVMELKTKNMLSISETTENCDEKFLQKSVSFVCIANPLDVYTQIFALTAASHLAEMFSLEKNLAEILGTELSTEISFQNEIFPLLDKHFAIAVDENGKKILAFHTVSKTFPSAQFDIFSEKLDKASQKISPEIVKHILEDGTEIAELFPNSTKVIKEEKNDAEHKVVSFSSPDGFLGMQYAKDILTLSSSEHLWKDFVFPVFETKTDNIALGKYFSVLQKNKTEATLDFSVHLFPHSVKVFGNFSNIKTPEIKTENVQNSENLEKTENLDGRETSEKPKKESEEKTSMDEEIDTEIKEKTPESNTEKTAEKNTSEAL